MGKLKLDPHNSVDVRRKWHDSISLPRVKYVFDIEISIDSMCNTVTCIVYRIIALIFDSAAFIELTKCSA